MEITWQCYDVHFPDEKLGVQRGLICAQVRVFLHIKKCRHQANRQEPAQVPATKASGQPRTKLYLMCLLRQWLTRGLERGLERLLPGDSWRDHRLSQGWKRRCGKKAKSWHLSIRRKRNLCF